MKVINVSSEAGPLNALLEEARREMLILESETGDRFVLTPLGEWLGFEVGESEDFTDEVAQTVRNDELMNALADRKKANGSQRHTLEEIKGELDLK